MVNKIKLLLYFPDAILLIHRNVACMWAPLEKIEKTNLRCQMRKRDKMAIIVS